MEPNRKDTCKLFGSLDCVGPYTLAVMVFYISIPSSDFPPCCREYLLVRGGGVMFTLRYLIAWNKDQRVMDGG